MDWKNLAKILGFKAKDNTVDIYEKQYPQFSYSIEIDFNNKTINYGDKIDFDRKNTQNFSQPENAVVLECVDRLLTKGYKPQNLILEKVYPAGHGHSGRLDICVNNDDGSEYLLIECKTYGTEFDEELRNINKNGGQLFTYFRFSNEASFLMLYTSKVDSDEIVYKNEIVKIEEDYKTGDVKDFYDKWNKLTKDNGIFDDWVKPYCFESKALTYRDIVEIKEKDSSIIFHSFLKILRHNVVSDKPNAFNKIFNLFLCKIYDEKIHEDSDEELDFQWKEGVDDFVSFQLRLSDLYKEGMKEFLEKIVTDFSEKEFETKYKNLDDNTKQLLKNEFKLLRLEKNNEFAIKEVYDKDSFNQNSKVVKEIVQLIQPYKIRYAKKQQYLSDFFELLLTTGLKQESGQYFTPVPIAQYIVRSLPVKELVYKSISEGKKDNLLPYVIDYSSGSGHFLTESMNEIQKLLDNSESSNYKGDTKKFIEVSKIDKFYWANKYIYGIEKDYRLVKVCKVGCYLHGDGLANVIHSDGLANFYKTKEYKGILKKYSNDNLRDNQRFDIVVSNPPYSVDSFRNVSRDYYTEDDFELYNSLTDNSSQIECLFVERTKQLLKDGGIAGIILPSSILTNTGIYTKTREILLKYFEIIGITELGSNTFMATGTSTVVLFLRRRNNYDPINLQKSIEKFFETQNDVTINNIETPVAKYVNYVFDGVTIDDYLTLLNKQPNDNIKNHNIYKEYKQKIEFKNEDEFLNKVIDIEKEKLYYFIICYSQKVVIVKTGEKDKEKQFLGYEFSKGRGREGIHPIQKSKTIEECTKLFDIKSFDNPKKASTYIYKAFNGDFNFEIDETLKENISRINLIDMMTFDRVDFEKVINTKSKKKVKIESKYPITTLENVCESIVAGGDALKIYSKEKNDDYSVPIYSNGTDENSLYGYTNIEKVKKDSLSISARGTIGYAKIRKAPFYPIVRLIVATPNLKIIKLKYLESIVKYLDIEKSGATTPQLTVPMIKTLKLPLPPLNIQQKIVDEIEKVEKITIDNQKTIAKNCELIEKCIKDIMKRKHQFINLGELVEILDNKRIPLSKNEREKGNIPYYGATGIIDYVSKYIFDEKLVLIGEDGAKWGANENSAFQIDGKTWVNNHAHVLKPNRSIILDKFLIEILNKQDLSSYITGQNVPKLNKQNLCTIKIPLPPIEEQQKVVEEIEKLEQEINNAQQIIDDSKNKKQEILKKYL